MLLSISKIIIIIIKEQKKKKKRKEALMRWRKCNSAKKDCAIAFWPLWFFFSCSFFFFLNHKWGRILIGHLCFFKIWKVQFPGLFFSVKGQLHFTPLHFTLSLFYFFIILFSSVLKSTSEYLKNTVYF